jgi:hypothetical protein
MNTYLVNLVDGLSSVGGALGALALGHYFTCDCLSARRGGWRNDSTRFLRGVS